MTDTKKASPIGRLGKEVGGMLGAAGKRGRPQADRQGDRETQGQGR